jgi:hypothetical protein
LIYPKEELNVPDGPFHVRGIITLQDNEKFKWREEHFEDAM